MGRPLRLADLAGVQLPGEPTISPDGHQVVYVLRTTDPAADADLRALWSVRTVDGAWGVPFRLTRGTADTAPSFAPQGNRIAFLRGGNGPTQLHLLDVSGGEAEQVTQLPAGAGTPVWSPSGDRIAFTAPVRRSAQGNGKTGDGETGDGATGDGEAREHEPLHTHRLGYKADGTGMIGTVRSHVHVLELATGDVRQITDGDWHAGSPAWSPDGTRIAFSAAPEPDADITQHSAAYVLDLATGSGPRKIGPARGVAGPVAWTSDGSALLVTGQQEFTVGHTELLRLPVEETTEGGNLAAALDRSVMPGGAGYPGGLPQLTPDGSAVVFCVRDRGCSHVYRTDLHGRSGPQPVLTGDDVVVSGLAVAARADVAAVVVADPGTFGEVAVVPLDGRGPTMLTRHTATALPDVELFRPESRTFRGHDGTEIHGWLLRDPDAPTPGPLLVDAHGGPHNAWSPAADAAHPYHQVLAARGWSVLMLNVRGSDGYGTGFFTAAARFWGTADERDFLDPVDELVSDGVADPARLALTGYSYGGYMTCWLTGRTDRFAAAIAGGVVADLTSMWGTSDAGPALARLEWPDPFAEPERLAAISPWSRVQHVRTPTLLLHGSADERCPVGQAEQWFAALRSRNVPTEMVLYPGGSHLFVLDGRPSHRTDYSQRLLDWTERYAGAGPGCRAGPGDDGGRHVRRRAANAGDPPEPGRPGTGGEYRALIGVGECDLVLVGARVIDPESGLDGIRAVGITDGTITAVTEVPLPARVTVDLSGLVLAPGFVDLHSHAQTITGHRLQALDGVTTALELEAGVLPVTGGYARAEAEGRPLNFGFSASWTDARMHVLDGVPLDGDSSLDTFSAYQSGPRWRGPADDRDVARILGLLEEGVGQGALGIGILVGYAPDSGRAEYYRLAGLAARLGVPTFTHTRYISTEEPGTSLEGALEVIAAAAGTGAHMHICHVNSTSTRMIDEVAGAVDAARGAGVRVSTEAYPYGAGSTVIGASFLAPDVLHRMGISPPNLTYLATGERVADADRLRDLRAADPAGLVVVHFLDEDEPADLALLERSFTLADTAIATDAMPLVRPGGGPVPDGWPLPPGLITHPRSAGSYARTLRWLVRERGLLTLTEALRRSSLLPAQILEAAVPAMLRKGRVQVGADADLVAFDPATVTDSATYTEVAPSTGFRLVLVGGVAVVRDGEVVTSALPGRAIRSGDR